MNQKKNSRVFGIDSRIPAARQTREIENLGSMLNIILSAVRSYKGGKSYASQGDWDQPDCRVFLKMGHPLFQG